MAQEISHVPKFGNWEGESVPYTACFENARKEKANGIRINPNDPLENPQAFTNLEEAPKKNRFHKRNPSDQLKSATHRSTSSSDSSVNSGWGLKPHQHQRRISDRIQIPPLLRENYVDDYSCRSAVVPKFGPRTAEGFALILNKVKEEKQIAAVKFPSLSPKHNANIDYHSNYKKQDIRRKRCCGLF